MSGHWSSVLAVIFGVGLAIFGFLNQRLTVENEELKEENEIYRRRQAHQSRKESKSLENLEHDENLCKICLAKSLEIIFQPCGHVCSCLNCSQKLIKCPICRQKIVKKQKFYVS